MQVLSAGHWEGVLAGLLLSPAYGNSLPAILSDWWSVAGNPNVDPYTTTNQQPVDFGIWQAADRTWQIWSCIRRTSYPANTRLFHGQPANAVSHPTRENVFSIPPELKAEAHRNLAGMQYGLYRAEVFHPQLDIVPSANSRGIDIGPTNQAAAVRIHVEQR